MGKTRGKTRAKAVTFMCTPKGIIEKNKAKIRITMPAAGNTGIKEDDL